MTSPVKAGLRPPPPAADGLDRACHPAFVGHRGIYQEAKSNGFDVKIIREMIRLRKQDPKERAELEMLLEEYWQAIKQAAPTGKKAA